MENSIVPRLSINRAAWREILAAFMPSEIMGRHLENFTPTKEQLRDLICFAPVPISKKLDWLQKLACRCLCGPGGGGAGTAAGGDVSSAEAVV